MPYLKTPHGRELSASNVWALASECQTLEHADGYFSKDDIRRARHSLPRGKTCGDDNIVTLMPEACNSADWFCAVAFNQRVANTPAGGDPGRIGAGPIWDAFKIRLLSKCDAPTQLRFLRPIAILLASAKLWSRACFQKLSAFGTDRNEAHLGFCPGCSCVELVTTTRLVLERRSEWGA